MSANARVCVLYLFRGSIFGVPLTVTKIGSLSMTMERLGPADETTSFDARLGTWVETLLRQSRRDDSILKFDSKAYIKHLCAVTGATSWRAFAKSSTQSSVVDSGDVMTVYRARHERGSFLPSPGEVVLSRPVEPEDLGREIRRALGDEAVA